MNERGSPWSWYAAKTVYRAVGRWRGRDACPSPVSLIEERIVLLRARSWHEAETKAFKEARTYASVTQPDPNIRWRPTRVIDACTVYELAGEPTSGKEVFCTIEYVKRKVPTKEIVDRKLDGHRQRFFSRPESLEE